MAKERAPVTLTGGGGFNFEDANGGRALVDMLAGAFPYGETFGTIVRIDWQARDADHLLDDLVLTLERQAVVTTAEISIKSDRQVTESGFPENFVEAAWEQWLQTEGDAFRKDRDLLVLITGKLANSVAEAWEKLLREAQATTPERMLARLRAPADEDEGAHTSQLQRALFASFECPAHLSSEVTDEPHERIQLFRRVRLLHADFTEEPSRDESRAVLDCQAIVRSGSPADATSLWNSLLRIAAELRGVGGSLTRGELLARLRDQHELRDFPDYRADWEAIGRWSGDILDGIATQVGGRRELERPDVVSQLGGRLRAQRVCLVVGESGCGKSAAAKMVAERNYASVAALPGEAFETGRLPAAEQFLGLRHSLVAVLANSRSDCLVLLDSIDRFSENGIRLVGRIISQILRDAQLTHIQFLLTAQFEGAERVAMLLVEGGLDRTSLAVESVNCPAEEEIRTLLEEFREVPWSAVHQDMRPLLRNLKILDWVVRASQRPGGFPAATVTHAIALIEYLWGRWVEGTGAGIARSGLLKRLALAESATLSTGIPLMSLEHAEQLSVPDLVTSDLLRVRHERVRFSHDLLGDWARLKILIGEDPTLTADGRARGGSVRWHRAVRLYGRWLLSQVDGPQRWQAAIERADDGSTAGTILRDLLLEAVILSDGPGRLLESVWPILVAQDGTYLKRLLDRFLFVATIPDARIQTVAVDEDAAEQMGIVHRVPFWPYWLPMLATLNAHPEEVVTLALPEAAKVCKLWLRSVPVEFSKGIPFPLRRQTADLALQLAHRTRHHAEQQYIDDEAQRDCYEAALLGAPDRPDEVAAFALEVAERRPTPLPNVDESAPVNEGGAPGAVRRTPRRSFGRRRDPWPEGPRDQVDSAFVDAVLGGQGIVALALVRPEAAVEVLLAVCIEEPQVIDYQTADLFDDFGTIHWQDGYPPFYYRGPFLLLLRTLPRQGVSFVVRLVNFATDRWCDRERMRARQRGRALPTNEELGTELILASGTALWLGDAQVYRWHADGAGEARVVTCALMALEKWLYDSLDEQQDAAEVLTQILRESRSLAFAGLLIDVGKKAPALFTHVLRPLLGQTLFYHWDQQVVQHAAAGLTPGLIAWAHRAPSLIEDARNWHLAEHRRSVLRLIAQYLMIQVPDMRPFFSEQVRRWRAELEDGSAPQSIRPLIESLTFENYVATPLEDGRIQYEFQMPADLQADLSARQQDAQETMLALMLPMNCRQILNGEASLVPEQLDDFLRNLEIVAAAEERDPEMPSQREDGVMGAIAVLLIQHHAWLSSQPEKLAWCLEQVQAIAATPPPQSPFDVAESAGDHKWDVFLAEIGVMLLLQDRNDPFARGLVARGVAGFHYGTTRKTMQRAFQHRQALGNLFTALENMVVHWSKVRRLRRRSEELRAWVTDWGPVRFDDDRPLPAPEELDQEVERWRTEHRNLIDAFLSGAVAPLSLQTAHAETESEIRRLEAVRFPEGRQRVRNQGTGSRREKIHLLDPMLDVAVLASGFGWVNLAAATSPSEREWLLARIAELVQLSLRTIPRPENDQDELDGYPSDFDSWVQNVACRAIVRMEVAAESRSLWVPYLELGTFAHYWVEHFFWAWFSEGIATAPSPAIFAAHWKEMLRFALQSEAWTGNWPRRQRLDRMVCELLGYHFGFETMAKNAAFQPLLAELKQELGQAAERWLVMEDVAGDFASNVVQPAYELLLPAGVEWLHAASEAADPDDFWRDSNLEEPIIAVLRRCWEAHQSSVVSEPSLRDAFIDLLATLASRGSHAAIHLRDRVLDSMPAS